MAVTVRPTEIPAVLEIESPVHRDGRGYFTELDNTATWGDAGFRETFVQDNMSFSAKGTLRGLHYQLEPHGQGKLVRVLRGSIFDAAVDLRRGSPTYGKWIGRTLSEENARALWVPIGFAHGFLVLEDDTQVLYKCTAPWSPEAERTIVYNDPAIGIEWPIEPTSIKPRDADAPVMADAEHNFSHGG
jgi:dTDP-4-dehydrorhamnose 3,5-epimerase